MKNLRALIYDIARHLQLVNTGCYCECMTLTLSLHTTTPYGSSCYFFSRTVRYNPDMKEDDPRVLLNQQIPHSFVQLQDAIRDELLTLRMKNQPPIMEEKEFRGKFLKLFNSISEMEEAVRFLTLQG